MLGDRLDFLACSKGLGQSFCKKLSFFGKEDAPVAIGLDYLRIVGKSYVGLGIGVVLGNAITAAKAAKTAFRVDVGVLLAFQFPVCLVAVLVLKVSLLGLFQCVAATAFAGALAYGAVYLRGHWVAEGRAHDVGEGRLVLALLVEGQADLRDAPVGPHHLLARRRVAQRLERRLTRRFVAARLGPVDARDLRLTDLAIVDFERFEQVFVRKAIFVHPDDHIVAAIDPRLPMGNALGY